MENKHNFKIGVIIDFIMKNFEDGVLKARDLKVDGIQFHATSGEMAPENLSKGKRRELLKLIKDNGIIVSAVCADFGGHGFECKEQNLLKIEKSKRIVELAKDLECDIITTHIGTIGKSPIATDNQLNACVSLGEFATATDACFAIETGPETCAALKEFITTVGSKGIGVNFDPGNLVMVTDDDPVEGVYLLKDLIVHTHAKDGVMLKRTQPYIIYDYFAQGGIEDFNLKEYFREEALGNGDVDFKNYFKALSEISYNGFLTIERELSDSPLEDIGMSVDFIRNMTRDYI